MLAKLGCRYVVVGHTERREYHDEDDAVVNAKVKAAYRHGLTPDPLRRRGPGGPPGGRARRARAGPARRGAGRASPRSRRALVVAYEPVWAIGTGEVATPDDAQEVCAAIRTRLAELYSGDTADGVRILYGGSVKAANVAAIMAEADVDGALVGGREREAEEFAGICRYRDHVTAEPDRASQRRHRARVRDRGRRATAGAACPTRA